MAKAKNRKERRKESKRIEEAISEDSNFMDKFFVVAGVILFILCFYILTVYITNNNKTATDEEEEVIGISKDKIILGRSLSMSKDDYLVVYYNSGDEAIEGIISGYSGELSIYKVDMSSAFNKKYATDGESNKNPSKVSEFKINGPTLIKVSNKKVADYIEGEEAIRSYLN